MKIERIRALRGPNLWSKHTAIEAVVTCAGPEADLDQIGMITGAPDEEPHASAYQGALEGEVAIIRFT